MYGFSTKKLASFCFLLISMGFISEKSFSTIVPYEEEGPWFQSNSEQIIQEAVKYLKSKNLDPLFTSGETVFTPNGIDNLIFRKGLVTFAGFIATITQGDKSFIITFEVRRNDMKGNKLEVSPLYLSNTTISNMLFYDIMKMIIAFSKEADIYKKPRFIYIDNLEDKPNGIRIQKWTFYGEHDSKEVLINLIPDSHGGTTFEIKSNLT